MADESEARDGERGPSDSSPRDGGPNEGMRKLAVGALVFNVLVALVAVAVCVIPALHRGWESDAYVGALLMVGVSVVLAWRWLVLADASLSLQYQAEVRHKAIMTLAVVIAISFCVAWVEEGWTRCASGAYCAFALAQVVLLMAVAPGTARPSGSRD